MISEPPKAKTTSTKQLRKPPRPVAKKPPCDHRLLTPWLVSCMPKPKISTAVPPAIMATMAVILTMVSQNSTSPKTRTRMRFSAAMKKITASTQIHFGTCGNHIPM